MISQYALSKSRNIYWLKAHGFKRRWCFNLLRDARDQIETEPNIELTKKEKKVSISFRSDLVFVLRFGIGFEIGFEVESCCSATKWKEKLWRSTVPTLPNSQTGAVYFENDRWSMLLCGLSEVGIITRNGWFFPFGTLIQRKTLMTRKILKCQIMSSGLLFRMSSFILYVQNYICKYFYFWTIQSQLSIHIYVQSCNHFRWFFNTFYHPNVLKYVQTRLPSYIWVKYSKFEAKFSRSARGGYNF